MFCDQCGKQHPDGTRFCTDCGNPLPQGAPAKKKHGKGLLIAGICAGFLLIAIAVIGLLFLFPGKETVYLLARQTNYDAEGNIVSSIVYDYDPSGRLICAQLQNEAGEPHRQFRMEYDEYGNRTLEASEIFPKDSGLTLTHETVYDFSYDEDGRVEECEFSLGKEDSDISCEFTYDDDDNLILVEWDNESEFPSGPYWQYYEYDKEGNLTAEYFCNLFYYGFVPDAVASQVSRNTYEYDKKGNVIEIATATAQTEKKLDWDDLSDLDFQTKQRWDYEYDSKGRLCAVDGNSVDYDENGNIDAEGFVFDEFGNLICQESSSGSRIEYTYQALTLSRKDAQAALRQKSCLPSDFMSITYVLSLDPLKLHMYPFVFRGNMFYSYMIPHPIW